MEWWETRLSSDVTVWLTKNTKLRKTIWNSVTVTSVWLQYTRSVRIISFLFRPYKFVLEELQIMITVECSRNFASCCVVEWLIIFNWNSWTLTTHWIVLEQLYIARALLRVYGLQPSHVVQIIKWPISSKEEVFNQDIIKSTQKWKMKARKTYDADEMWQSMYTCAQQAC